MSIATLRILVIASAYALTYLFAQLLGALYVSLFPHATGGNFIGAPGTIEWILGLPITLIFLVTFLMHSVGGKNIWLWNIVALCPAILFEIVFDATHIYFPVILGVIAWFLGTLVNNILKKSAPSLMRRIS
ncbi:MAG TPA: hypothetical protein VNM40_03690 [Candidatus Paceibacterota bacterium]|nr:hypothetical protein [Candidatus Paceibacterota bacterium]